MKISSNKKSLWLLAVALVVIAGYWGFRSARSHPDHGQSSQDRGPEKADGRRGGPGRRSSQDNSTVKRQDLVLRVTVAGTVSPRKRTIITAPYSGYVKKLYVKVGDIVKQNDPLVSVVQSLQSGEDAFPLRSPLNGQVVQVPKSEGEFVKATDTTDFILRIDDTSALFVNANAPEIDRVKLRIGQEAVIKASAILGRTYKGVIRELSLAAREKEQWSRSQVVDFPIRVEILDKDEVIQPGMTVLMDMITSKKENVLTLRHEFIRRQDGNYYVILQSGERRDIEVGLQNEEAFEIISGLKEGERVKQVDFADMGAD